MCVGHDEAAAAAGHSVVPAAHREKCPDWMHGPVHACAWCAQAGPPADCIWVTPMDSVREFHDRFGCPTSDAPAVPSAALVDLRRRLLCEEARQADEAQEAGDLVAIAQELADVVYVAYGTALTYGIDLDSVIGAVHEANMTKERGTTGKAVKGPGFVPADVAAILAASAVQEDDSWAPPTSGFSS